MKRRFRLYRRSCTGRFYLHDQLTGKQHSLHTTDRAEARRLCHARNEAEHQPGINVQIAHAYLAAGDPAVATRTWQAVMDEIVQAKQGSSRQRWVRAVQEKALDLLRPLPVLQTRPEQFLQVLQAGRVSTNLFLRRLHNFALGLGWLPWPVLSKSQWPVVRYGERRALTGTEHQAIVAAESDPERKAFYELAWHVGAAQGDLAALRAEDVDWEHRILSFTRQKTGTLTVLRFGDEVAALLRQRPALGPLFPRWSQISASERACRFARRCRRLQIVGVSLHSYRYAWAERAKMAGYPERFAQEALGHKSQAVHRAYARKARVELPPLEEYEKLRAEQKLIRLPVQSSAPVPAEGTVT